MEPPLSLSSQGAPAAPAEALHRSSSVLLVEDNEDDLLLTLRAFAKSAMDPRDVAVARDGAEALDFLFARGAHADRGRTAPPRLVLLDIKLPRMTGLDVLRALRSDARTRLVPVVMLTSSLAERDLLEGYGHGANSYIQKPVGTKRFDEVIRRTLSYWLELNETPHA